MGHSSIISNTAPSDGLFQNEACKYYEVDQTVFEEKLVPRGKESGRHLLSLEFQRPEEPRTELIDIFCLIVNRLPSMIKMGRLSVT